MGKYKLGLPCVEEDLKPFRRNIFLASVFIIALPVFAWLRWDPAPWIDAQLKTRGLSDYVQVARVKKSGLGLRLSGIRIRSHRGPDISPINLRLNPAWSRIIRGIPALHVQGTMGDATFGINISMRNSTIRLNEMDVRARADMIKDYYPRAAMLNLAGSMRLSGDIQLHRSTGLPLTGHLKLRWQKAASGILNADDLGNFQFLLSSSAKGRWQWQAKGGSTLLINGSGHLSTLSPNPGLWRIDGNVHVQSRDELATLFASLAGSKTGIITLSGSINHPSIRWRK